MRIKNAKISTVVCVLLCFFDFYAPLAQLDRVPVFGTGGSGSNPARGKFFFDICFDALLLKCSDTSGSAPFTVYTRIFAPRLKANPFEKPFSH